MLKMTESTRNFLKENLPECLNSDHLGDVLDKVYDWIDLHGFGPDSLYNHTGKEAQAAYDDLYFSNRKLKSYASVLDNEEVADNESR